jgi:hypothetical protein
VAGRGRPWQAVAGPKGRLGVGEGMHGVCDAAAFGHVVLCAELDEEKRARARPPKRGRHFLAMAKVSPELLN